MKMARRASGVDGRGSGLVDPAVGVRGAVIVDRVAQVRTWG